MILFGPSVSVLRRGEGHFQNVPHLLTMRMLAAFCLIVLFTACSLSENEQVPKQVTSPGQSSSEPFLLVLGIAQDAGFPQADCKKECCVAVWEGRQQRRRVSCLGLVDPVSGQSWLFDATPDFKRQLNSLQQYAPNLSGIFLTHAHIGHYTGLMHLGREAMGTQSMPVYAMPRMLRFLRGNGPWSQLADLQNIALQPLQADSTILLDAGIRVTPFLVPHRDEFSETVGYQIEVKEKMAVFIPDIDKWEKWDRNIVEVIKRVDIAFVDGTFFQNGELPGRDMSEIPHPFVEESMQLFGALSAKDKSKIHFIHFNHTNPLLKEGSEAQQQLEAAGFRAAKEGAIIAF